MWCKPWRKYSPSNLLVDPLCSPASILSNRNMNKYQHSFVCLFPEEGWKCNICSFLSPRIISHLIVSHSQILEINLVATVLLSLLEIVANWIIFLSNEGFVLVLPLNLHCTPQTIPSTPLMPSFSLCWYVLLFVVTSSSWWIPSAWNSSHITFKRPLGSWWWLDRFVFTVNVPRYIHEASRVL